MTRVIILTHGGNFATAYFAKHQMARDFVNAWVQGHKERLERGEDVDGNIQLLAGLDYAVLNRYIIGMYIPEDKPSTQERMTEAFERLTEVATQQKE